MRFVRRLAVFSSLTLACLAADIAPLVAAPKVPEGMAGVGATERGDWFGSWVYGSRDQWFAIFIRDQDGEAQVKVQYQSLDSPENFETGWDGKAEYFVFDNPARFVLEITSQDETMIQGRWNWISWRGTTSRTEVGTFTLVRLVDGLRMALWSDDLVLTRWLSGREVESITGRRWDFVKASRRVVRWEELPF